MFLDNLFYDPYHIAPKLRNIHALRHQIMHELKNIMDEKSNEWNDWPEKELYAMNGKWKIFPLYAFQVWVDENCQKLPTLTRFIKSIPGVKLATLSKLTSGMRLTPHEGWGNHSNNVLRAHYGLHVPYNKCYIEVSDKKRTEKVYHCMDEWLMFDDSKTHFAENTSDQDRIVLILDIERPWYVKKGVSAIGDSKELLEIIDYFRERNKIK